METPTPNTLHDDPSRYVLYPIKHQDLWSMYKKAQASFWTAEEIDLARDIQDWELKLSEPDRTFLKHVLAFFAASDGIVNENLAERFMNEVEFPEARAFYAFQIAIETVHSETYALLLDTLISERAEKLRLLRAVQTIPVIRNKAAWAQKWISCPKASFAQRLIAFACVEGIFFSGSFCAIYWIKERGVMPGMCFSNELISRDEALHTEFAIRLYRNHTPVDELLDEETAHAMITEAVRLEKEFVLDAFPCSLLGMNAELMAQYICFVSDRLLVQLGYSKLYNTTNPFPFMERISMECKTNFFEKRVAEYSLFSKKTDATDGKDMFADAPVDF